MTTIDTDSTNNTRPIRTIDPWTSSILAPWLSPPALIWPTVNNEKRVSCPSHVRLPGMLRGIQVKPVVTAAAHPGSGCRCHGYHAGCCRKGPRRQRITTAWGIRSCWVDGKAVATQKDEGLQPITAQRVMMHNVNQAVPVFLICKLRWNIYQSAGVLGIWMNRS